MACAWAVLAAFALLVGIGHAVAAPAGSGWQYCGGVCFQSAPEGSVFEVVFAFRESESCSSPVTYEAPELSPEIGVDWLPVTCLDGSGAPVPETEAGVWFRTLYVSPEPPDDPASSPTGDLSKVEGHLELLAYAGFVLAAGLGYSGGRLR